MFRLVVVFLLLYHEHCYYLLGLGGRWAATCGRGQKIGHECRRRPLAPSKSEKRLAIVFTCVLLRLDSVWGDVDVVVARRNSLHEWEVEGGGERQKQKERHHVQAAGTATSWNCSRAQVAD